MNCKIRRIFSLALALFAIVFIFCAQDKEHQGTALLRFKIIDADTKQPIPGKLVFIERHNDKPNLNIPDTYGLAAEDNGVYSAFGQGEIEVPTGEYTVYASRGMEYSIDKKKIRFDTDMTVETEWLIKRELDPKGYVGCDFHMHTTESDGNCSVEERVTSLVAEGVEFAASADHNFVSDFEPAVKSLGVEQYIKTCPGDEYTTEVGHYNAFPLPVVMEPFEWQSTDPRIHFGYVRALPGPVVLQVNHPRSDGLDYFGLKGLDPVTSESADPTFSWDFDAMEIMNETEGWGLFTGPNNRLSVWDDWFNFLNKDFRVTGVGNTDSHTLIRTPVGTPRTYVANNIDNPDGINANTIAKNIIAHRASVARGVFVNLTVNKRWPIGTEVIDTDGTVELLVEVQSPSWTGADKVTIYGNGREVWSKKIRGAKGQLYFEKKVKLHPEVDTWYLAKAEGSEDMWPIVAKQEIYKITPVGFTNPIWVDVDGNGFECERDRASRFLSEHGDDVDAMLKALEKTDWWFQRQLYALLDKGSRVEIAVAKSLLSSKERSARTFAYRRIAELGGSESIELLRAAKKNAQDKNERLLLETYLMKLGDCHELMAYMLKVAKTADPYIRAEQIKILSLNQFQRDWQVVGPFPNKDNKGLDTPYDPEREIDLSVQYIGKGGRQIGWKAVTAYENGYVNFINIFENTDHSVAYAYGKIDCQEKLKTVLLFGSDDGAAIWHNGKEIYRRFVRRGANPGEEIIPITLAEGENTFLVKVENGGGGWGFYFEIVDPCKVLTTK